MNRKPDKLSHEFGAHLASIRLAVGKLTGAQPPWDAESPFDLVHQGDRMVRCYENWLLDNEQKQMLSVHPEDKFILYASSYLCDIGLTDGQGLPPLAKDFKDDRTGASFNPALGTRSCRLKNVKNPLTSVEASKTACQRVLKIQPRLVDTGRLALRKAVHIARLASSN